MERILSQLLNFVVSVILARILLPEDFGLVGISLVLLAVCTVIVDGGLTSSLIRTDSPTDKDYGTVQIITLLGSVVFYTVLFLAAPAISTFFEDNRITMVLRVLGLVIVIKSLFGVQKARLTKMMDFKTQLSVEIPSIIVSGLVGVGLAVSGFGIWSLVWMHLVHSLATCIQFWIRSSWKPKFAFDSSRFRYHFNFGYKITISSLLGSIYNNVYTLVVGKYFSMAQLGFYMRAESLAMLPVSSVSLALNRVAYPALSSIQNDGERLKSIYRRLMRQVIFWLAPLLCLTGVLAKPIFIVLLTEKWLPAVPYFQILCVAGILYPIHEYNLNILKVKGRSDLFLRLEFIKRVTLTISLLFALPFGIYGLLYMQVIFSFAALVINSYYSGRLIGYPLNLQLLDLFPTILVAAITGILVFILDEFIVSHYNLPIIVRLAFDGFVGASAYLGFSFIGKNPALVEFRQVIAKL